MTKSEEIYSNTVTHSHRRRKVSSVGGHWHTLPFPSLPFPLLPPPFPSPLPLPLEVGPLIAARGLGSALAPRALAPPAGPAAKRYLVNFRLKISLLV